LLQSLFYLELKMTNCPQCGRDLSEEGFCPQCGAEVDVVREPAPPEIPGFFRTLIVCFLKKYCSFKGRASRSEFWYFILWLAIFRFVIACFECTFFLLFFSASGGDITNVEQRQALIVFQIVLHICLRVYVFCPVVGVSIRRFHDVGLSGKIVVPLALAFYGLHPFLYCGMIPKAYYIIVAPILALPLIVFAVAVRPGTRGPNKYGPAPRKKLKQRRRG
jgi:uncharacterized membrane protein YhaH (DUF805 family)